MYRESSTELYSKFLVYLGNFLCLSTLVILYYIYILLPSHLLESSNFCVRCSSFSDSFLCSMALWVSMKAKRCPRSVKYLVYMPATLMAVYSMKFAMIWKSTQLASRGCRGQKCQMRHKPKLNCTITLDSPPCPAIF